MNYCSSTTEHSIKSIIPIKNEIRYFTAIRPDIRIPVFQSGVIIGFIIENVYCGAIIFKEINLIIFRFRDKFVLMVDESPFTIYLDSGITVIKPITIPFSFCSMRISSYCGLMTISPLLLMNPYFPLTETG